MAMMAKMRSLAPAFIIGVGGLFVLFMVISDSNVLEALGGRSNNVGSVNGTDITYQEFQQVFDQQLENQKQQTGQEVDVEQYDLIRDQVWQALVTQKLVNQKIEELGLTVTDQEIKDIILGDNPPQFLRQNFIDSLGQFNRQLYETALFDPQNREVMIQAEQIVRQQRMSEKLQSYIAASVVVSEDEVKRRFIDQNIEINAKYAYFNPFIIPDSLVSVSEEDIEQYYNSHLDKYKKPAQRKLKYVLFSNQPTADDTLQVINSLERVKEYASRDTVSFKSAVEIYSSLPYSVDTVSIAELSPAFYEAYLKSGADEILGPFATPQGMALYKIVDVVESGETFARASHILIQSNTDEEAYKEALNIYNEILDGADFETVAKEKSKDVASGRNGGDLGWFGRGRMVPEFENAVFNAKEGELLKPVKTGFGYHIIKVTGKTNKKFIVEKIVNPVVQSAASRDVNYQKASDFAYLAEKNGFEKEAEMMNYTIQETPLFLETAVSVPGIGGSKKLVEFAFSNALNDISYVHKGNTGYVVAMISEVSPEGFKSLEEVRNLVENEVKKEKKFESAKQKAEKIWSKCNGDLNKILEIDPSITILETGKFKPASSIPGVGLDYAFLDAALELEPGQVSDIIKANRGYYIIKILEKTPFDTTKYNEQAASLRMTIFSEKQNAAFSQWLQMLQQEADIVDNRHLFFSQ